MATEGIQVHQLPSHGGLQGGVTAQILQQEVTLAALKQCNGHAL